MTNRREFIVQLSLGTGVLAAGQAMAQGAALSETDPAAVAQGYKADSTKVDAKKFPKHAATQTCANCALFQGKAGAATGQADEVATVHGSAPKGQSGWGPASAARGV